MAAQRYGGKYSPEGDAGTPPARRRRRSATAGRARVSLRARLLFLLPLPLLFAGLGAIGRGSAAEMLGELGGFAGLMLSAWLLNEGLRAEEAYAARAVARPPAIPRKLFAAVLTGASVFAAGLARPGQGMFGALAFGLVAAGAQLVAFGLDPMRKKGLEGVDAFATERIARAIDQAEALVRQTVDAAARIGDRRLEGRVDRLCDQARAGVPRRRAGPARPGAGADLPQRLPAGAARRDGQVRRHLEPQPRPAGAGAVRGAARRPGDQLRHASRAAA